MTSLALRAGFVLMGASLLLSFPCGVRSATAATRALFNGQDLSGWEKYLGPPFPGHEAQAQGVTPDSVFSVVEKNGEKLIRISGVVHGSLATREEFSNYHLRVVYKWGNDVTLERNSGLLYHGTGSLGAAFGTWMSSVECQMMHGHPGDLFLMTSALVCEVAVAARAGGDFFQPYAASTPVGEQVKRRLIHGTDDAENPLGEWNTIDLYCFEQTAVHVVNGRTVMVVEHLGTRVGDRIEPLTRGRLQLQSEGAELFVRSVTIEPIAAIPRSVLPETALQ